MGNLRKNIEEDLGCERHRAVEYVSAYYLHGQFVTPHSPLGCCHTILQIF